ncbi:MAG: reverse transcriptase domain-containing protein [Candidatus Thiodiazotropha sp.]
MKIAYANVRSLNTSFSLVESACIKQQFHILGLSEIWHPDNLVKENVRKSWNWISTERKEERGGGAALMISKDIKVYERKDLYCTGVEAVWCNVYSSEENFVVGSIYIPPNDSTGLKKLGKVIEKVLSEPLPLVLIGDFNAHHPYWHDKDANKLGNELFEFLVDKNMIVVNSAVPTRKDRIIDLTIVSSSLFDKVLDWKVQQEVYLNTDHSLISFSLGASRREEPVERFDFRKTNWSEWEMACTEAIEDWLCERSRLDSIDEDYKSFVLMLREKAKEIIPIKHICRHSKGWWNSKLTELSKNYRKAKRQFAKRCDEANENRLKEVLLLFKEEELRARDQYLDDMVKLLDPSKPSQFWNVINKTRKDSSKTVVQPIRREDNSLAVTDEEIFLEMKKRYGRESLEVKEQDEEWYNFIEEEMKVRAQLEQEAIQRQDFSEVCGHENSDLREEEVEAAISMLSNNSAPSPDEQIFNVLLKKGGEAMVKGLHYLFQKSWALGVLPEDFKLDPKVMLPKPGKSNYNTVRSYRPITLESVIGKVMERVICNRLVWKLEVEGGIARTQSAYRRQKSCVQTMVRVCNSITEARNRKEHTVLTVMDFESCYERIWRAGILHKAFSNGITGRMWVYIKNFLLDRHYYIKVNEYKSPVFKSAVGIPQGSVISPVLCNLYTSDSLELVDNKHAEFADDASLWTSDSSVRNACSSLNQDLNTVEKWCTKWNMSIAPEKTEVMVFTHNGKIPEEQANVKYGGETLKVTDSKKILGIVLDNNLNFKNHIQEKTKAGFSALRSLDSFVQGQRGCSQSLYMRLYRALVLPVLEYGSPVIVSSLAECCKEFGKVQRSAMIKASGCLNSTSTEALEVLTNTPPIDLQLKLRQAQEMVRIGAKYESDPLREDFDVWVAGQTPAGRKPAIFPLLMSRFREMSGKVEFDNIEKEFVYTKEMMGLMKVRGKVDTSEFGNAKSIQEENIRSLLQQISHEEIVIFTDGSALGNPGPTGAGAVVYLDGYQSSPILLKKGVSPMSNNYTGELVGIQIALEFITDLHDKAGVNGRSIHIFTDCQGAIISAFNNQIPKNKIDIILKIKECVNQILDNGNQIQVHWVPGHKDIAGNELADFQAKEAATEMSLVDSKDFPVTLDKKEAIAEIKKNLKVKWKRKYELSEKVEQIQEVFTDVGCRNCFGEKDRQSFSALNQILTGHTILNNHKAKIDSSNSNLCSTCKVPEDVHHFLFQCDSFSTQRDILEKTVEDILNREGLNSIRDVSLKVLIGNVENISKQGQNDLVGALLHYIQCTNRFRQN